MDASFEEFVENGGEENFKEELAAILRIDSSYITIVDAYEGSVIVIYDLKADETFSRNDLIEI